MNKIVTLMLAFVSSTVTVQAQKGIEFTKGLSWAQVKEKAKTENRYIFLDTYTTWCLPCKVMEKEIFPQQAVGDFFNKNFINVAAQLDVTKKDNEEVKRWYKDAKEIGETYQVNSFPTYLFFSPAGELIHKIEGASPTGEEFIEKAKKALDPSTQLELLKKRYAEGERDPEFLQRMIKVSRPAVYDPFTKELINEYLKTQENLLTEQNIKYILDATTKSADPGFNVLQKHADKVDAVAGTGASNELIKTIAFEEIGLPFVRVGGYKKEHGGGMVSYEGELKESVDWPELHKKFEAVYPSLAGELVAISKCEYFGWREDWSAYTEAVASYATGYPDQLHPKRLDAYCTQVLTWCSEPKALQAAIKWSEKNLIATNRKNAGYLYTHGVLLYKSGQKEQAINVMKEAGALSPAKAKGFAQVIEQINNGKVLWAN